MAIKWLTASLLCILIAAAGCAPTIRQISQSDVASEEAKKAKEDGRKDGYTEAYTVCKAEYEAKMEAAMENFMRTYRNEMLYLEAVKAGVLKPGQVTMLYKPGSVSDDGSVFVAPTLLWKVLSAPQFQSQEAAGWWKKDEANFCYFFLKAYENESKAMHAVGTVEKPDGVFLMSVAYDDKSGKFAVIGKTEAPKCEKVINDYQAKGYSPIRVK